MSVQGIGRLRLALNSGRGVTERHSKAHRLDKHTLDGSKRTFLRSFCHFWTIIREVPPIQAATQMRSPPIQTMKGQYSLATFYQVQRTPQLSAVQAAKCSHLSVICYEWSPHARHCLRTSIAVDGESSAAQRLPGTFDKAKHIQTQYTPHREGLKFKLKFNEDHQQGTAQSHEGTSSESSFGKTQELFCAAAGALSARYQKPNSSSQWLSNPSFGWS